MNEERVEFSKNWLLVLVLIIISFVLIGIFNQGGKVTSTYIENKIFENSYQRQAGLREEQSTYKAELARINVLLRETKDKETLKNLKAQKNMLEVQLQTSYNK